MTLFKYHNKTAITSALYFLSFVVGATDGYFENGYGTRSKGLAGADVAFSQDAISAALNPAGLTSVGDRLDIEGEFFSPLRQYNASGGNGTGFQLTDGVHQSNKNYYLIPTLGWSKKLDDTQSIGLAIYGNGGMNTDYAHVTNQNGSTGVFYSGRTGVDMAQGFLQGTYAHSFDHGRYSLGLSPILAVEYFEAQGLGSFGQQGYSSAPNQLSNNGREYSFGVGYKVGGQAELVTGVRLGVSYKSRTYMSQLKDYAGLFTGQGSFDIPSSLDTGLSWAVTDAVTTAFDVQQIFYSEINAVGNPLQPLLSGAKLGAGNGPGFGWKDMTVYKFGTQWKQSDQLTLRGGLSYGHQPIPSSQVLFNILAPAVQEWHIDGGFSYKLANKDELSFAFMYSPQASVSGANPLSPGQNIALSMTQYSLSLGWSRQF
ncbi:outer membrane protein transport protein [Methylomonas sp. AM2-LC]|uniref:OmpP1/FadL family transporter n=1 Tax=Methylomonas sp. AM2-LC TaxID=3153301 RepID=UPI003262EA85